MRLYGAGECNGNVLYVERLGSYFAAKAPADPGGPPVRLAHLELRPRPAVHARLAVGPERRPQAEQPRMAPRGDEAAACVLDVDGAVTGDAAGADVGHRQRLAGHRFHGIAPELGHVHTALGMPARSGRIPPPRPQIRRRRSRVPRSREGSWARRT